MKNILGITLLIFNIHSFAQVYPSFGPEKAVTIIGDTLDSMEPFISPDGNTLFFNSLNNGTTTGLYYATRINDTTFTFKGALNGVNRPTPHLDAVASMDSANHFIWVSNRNFPMVMQNLQHGVYNNAGTVSNTGKILGDFYILSQGWIVMDQGLSYDGKTLVYCNAFFNTNYQGCSGVPCKARLGMAQKINDSTFNKMTNTDNLFANVNDSTYLVYAPALTKDELELYFTRIKKGSFQPEICVSVRNTVSDSFSKPNVIYTIAGQIPEAPTLTSDKSKMYYHKKPSTLFKLFMRYRNIPTGTNETIENNVVQLYPNPSNNNITIALPDMLKPTEVTISNLFGQQVLYTQNLTNICVADFASGFYTIVVKQGGRTYTRKFIKNDYNE